MLPSNTFQYDLSLIVANSHGRIGLQPGTLIIMVDWGFSCKQLQRYLNVYNVFFEIWLQTFINLPIANSDREEFNGSYN
jgi:hypothetical protein